MAPVAPLESPQQPLQTPARPDAGASKPDPLSKPSVVHLPPADPQMQIDPFDQITNAKMSKLDNPKNGELTNDVKKQVRTAVNELVEAQKVVKQEESAYMKDNHDSHDNIQVNPYKKAEHDNNQVDPYKKLEDAYDFRSEKLEKLFEVMFGKAFTYAASGPDFSALRNSKITVSGPGYSAAKALYPKSLSSKKNELPLYVIEMARNAVYWRLRGAARPERPPQ
jgi:hypothetical protein